MTGILSIEWVASEINEQSLRKINLLLLCFPLALHLYTYSSLLFINYLTCVLSMLNWVTVGRKQCRIQHHMVIVPKTTCGKPRKHISLMCQAFSLPFHKHQLILYPHKSSVKEVVVFPFYRWADGTLKRGTGKVLLGNGKSFAYTITQPST